MTKVNQAINYRKQAMDAQRKYCNTVITPYIDNIISSFMERKRGRRKGLNYFRVKAGYKKLKLEKP